MVGTKMLAQLAKKHGTPLFVVDHDELRRNYATFRKYLPRVQAYFAVKALSEPAVAQTFFEAGASFDVASMPEFRIVHECIKDLPAWVFHGAKDPVVPVSNSHDMVEALKQCGSDVKLTVYPEAQHDSWTLTYSNPELYTWFLQHKRGDKK